MAGIHLPLPLVVTHGSQRLRKTPQTWIEGCWSPNLGHSQSLAALLDVVNWKLLDWNAFSALRACCSTLANSLSAWSASPGHLPCSIQLYSTGNCWLFMCKHTHYAGKCSSCTGERSWCCATLGTTLAGRDLNAMIPKALCRTRQNDRPGVQLSLGTPLG